MSPPSPTAALMRDRSEFTVTPFVKAEYAATVPFGKMLSCSVFVNNADSGRKWLTETPYARASMIIPAMAPVWVTCSCTIESRTFRLRRF